MTLAKARIINYDRNCSFIVLTIVIKIVNYNRKTFIVQGTGHTLSFKFSPLKGTPTKWEGSVQLTSLD